ncbi:MAG: ATP synthase F1 subunit epsilon [Puniceicoccales bacterium]|jgi:F-type H+-transporting ATPase subunit epsilon|nr:ATP synthase F1 subunit epsilon [Puniceicoccales bacterium]
MPLTIEIITPSRKVFSSTADDVVLPTQSGQINILPSHIPLTTIIVPGEVVIVNGTSVETLVVDKGYARVQGDVISILTEAAIDTDDIDLAAVEAAEERAATALARVQANEDFDPAEIEKMEQILRFAAVQKLIKRPRH